MTASVRHSSVTPSAAKLERREQLTRNVYGASVFYLEVVYI